LVENTFYNNSGFGISVAISSNNLFIDNVIYNNPDQGIGIGGLPGMPSSNNTFIGNIIFDSMRSISIDSSPDNIFIENKILNSTWQGVDVYYSSNISFINGTILNSADSDLLLGESQITVLNTTFDRNKVKFASVDSKFIVQLYLYINITDTLGNPIPSATVCIKDNQNSLPAKWYTTDSEGYIRWLTQTEYIEQDTNGDTIGEKTYYTPHRITAWNETLMGYAEVNINESKEVNIVLDTPYYEIPLTAGWNLISLPLEQSNTSIATVLSSIAGNWDVVWWYNAIGGTWHSTNDDLTDINHTMGFWIHMKTPDTLIVTGSIPNTTSIQLYQGWNLVGNPSFCIHGFGEIFASISGNYTAVQWFNAKDKGDPWKHYQINKPQELNDLKYITLGRGYWLYVKEDCVWEVSNF
jgi:parallel beta-helix repeat protein